MRRHPEGKQAGLGHFMGSYVSFWKRQRLWADAAPRVRTPASWEHLCAKRNVPLPQSRHSPPTRAPSFVSRVGENFSSHFPPCSSTFVQFTHPSGSDGRSQFNLTIPLQKRGWIHHCTYKKTRAWKSEAGGPSSHGKPVTES